MVYSDLIFVLGLFPLSAIISFLDRSAEYKNMILIISSVIFFTWGRPAIILLLFLTAVMDYLFGLGAASDKKLLKFVSLFLDFVMNTGTFVVFSWNSLFRSGGIFDRFEFFSAVHLAHLRTFLEQVRSAVVCHALCVIDVRQQIHAAFVVDTDVVDLLGQDGLTRRCDDFVHEFPSLEAECWGYAIRNIRKITV